MNRTDCIVKITQVITGMERVADEMLAAIQENEVSFQLSLLEVSQ